MPGYEGKTEYLELPCPVCGGARFTWGHLKRPQYLFLGPFPREFSWREQLSSEIGYAIHAARHCDTCSNVLMFTGKSAAPPDETSTEDETP